MDSNIRRWTLCLATVCCTTAALQADSSQLAEVAPPVARVAAPPVVAGLTQAPGYQQGTPAILHDNGPIVTHPAGGFNGADASALQDTSLAMTIFGFGHSVAGSLRVADDFTITDADGWDIEAIDFFAYQTGSSTTSTITAVNLQIWDGPPGDPASTVVFGDTTTNVLATSVFSNAYRTLLGTLTNSQRPIMLNTVTAIVHLDPGTYWLDWQTAGSLASGPWVPPITILGTTVTGDGQQFNTNPPWVALLDGTFAQGLPFVVRGTVVTVDTMPFLDSFESGDTTAWSLAVP